MKKRCKTCNVFITMDQVPEIYTYFIGPHPVKVNVLVPKGKCLQCNWKWEAEDARDIRYKAFATAIEEFWKSKLDEIGVSESEMAAVMFVASRLTMKLGEDKKRQIAAEMGRWLAGCHFQ